MYFDEEAAKWDTETRIKRAKILSDVISEKIDYTKGLTALEIGCGTGLISCNLIEKFNKIYCMDISKEMQQILLNKIKKFNISNIEVSEKDLIYSGRFYEKFDVVYSSMFFHHIDYIEYELKKIYKLLKTNGVVIIIDLDKDDGRFHAEEKDFHGHNGFDRDELKALMEKYNFKNVFFETAYEGKKDMKDGVLDYSLFLVIGMKR